MQRIYLLQIMVDIARTSPRQTVRELLGKISIDVDTYLDSTSNLSHSAKILNEGEAAEFTDKRHRDHIMRQLMPATGRRVETDAMMRSIVGAMNKNFSRKVAEDLMWRFLELHPDIAIVIKHQP